MIEREYIAELTQRVDISELVSSYVELKRAGRMERGLCPFHNEKTPSFYIYPETESYYCFGCGSGGSAINFVMNIQSLGYVEAVRFLAARVGMPMPDEDDDTAKRRGRMLSINRETAKFYVKCLNEEQGEKARVYLRNRALSDATIRKFGLGFSPDEFGALRDYLKSVGFAEDELVSAGVCKNGRNNSVYDAFRGRVMFPIMDLRGNVIAFGGRQMEDGGPKYLNSSDTMVFSKSQNLFALNIAKRSASKRFLLAEGYMDVISLHQAGFDTAVATLGTALTEKQAKLLDNHAKEVIICYDGDEAGQKATSRAIELFKRTSVDVNVLSLKGAKDPDEFIRKFGKDEFASVLDGSGNTIEYALNNVKNRFNLETPDGRTRYISAALEVLVKANPTERDIYAGRVAQEADVKKEAVLNQLESVISQMYGRMKTEKTKRQKKESVAANIDIPWQAGGRKALKGASAEQQLMAALLKNPNKYIGMVQGQITQEHFVLEDLGKAFSLVVEYYNEGVPIELATLSGELTSEANSLLGKIIAMNYNTGFEKEDVEMYIQSIKERLNGAQKAGDMTLEELKEYMNELRERKQ